MEFSVTHNNYRKLIIRNLKESKLPEIKDVDILICFECNSLTDIPNIEGLFELSCINCTSLTSIQNIHSLRKLYCSGCTSLTSISNFNGLKNLWFDGCTSLTSIPNIKGLKILNCDNCTSLASIPNIKGLENLNCSGCNLLTSIPNINNLRCIVWHCEWINPNEQKINNLIKLQKWFDRYIRRKSIEKLIPMVNNYWYSPDGPGGKKAIKRLNEIANKKS